MKIQDLTPPVAVPEPAWKQQLVEFWQQADDHRKLDLEVTLKMGDAAGARRVIESWQQELEERRKKQASQKKKKKKQRVRYGFGGYWYPGTAYAGQDHAAGAEGGDGGGESIREAVDHDAAIQQFFSEIVDDLDIAAAPKMHLHHDSDWSEKHGTFGRYDPANNTLELAVTGRHLMDIVRTMAHELVHCRQNEIDQLPGHAGETGSPWEDEANAVAGRILRGVAARHPELFKHDVVESSGYIPTEREKNDPRFSMALTRDVRPGATGKNANKLGLKTGPQGEPTPLMKNLRNALREFKETGQLPLTEDQDLFEIDMSPSNLRKLVRNIDARAGIEFEMIIPDINTEEEGELEADYDQDERIRSIDDAVSFFDDGEYNSSRDIRNLREELDNAYYEWLDEQIEDKWNNEGRDYLRDYIHNNELYDGSEEDLEIQTENSWEERDSNYDQAREEFREEFESMFDDGDWLSNVGYRYATDIERDFDVQWPHYTMVGGGDGEMDIAEVADDFSEAVGRPVEWSRSYHGARRRPGAYVVEPDGSLEGDDPSDGGLEFVSPPLPLDELLSDMQKIREWAGMRGAYTNRTTGLHMNVSVPDTSTAKLDYVKLALLLGDNYVLEQFGRAANTYAASALNKIRTILQSDPEKANALLEKMRGHMEALATKAVHTGETQKFTSINTKGNYVEFRSPGGDYLDANWDKVVPTLLRTVVALDAAMDPNKYREEYQKKLYKLLDSSKEKLGSPNVGKLLSMYFTDEQEGGSRDIARQLAKELLTKRQAEREARKGDRDFWWNVTLPQGSRIEVVARTEQEAREKAARHWSLDPKQSPISRARIEPLRPAETAAGQGGERWGIWITGLNKFASINKERLEFPSRQEASEWYQDRVLTTPGTRSDVEIREIPAEDQVAVQQTQPKGNPTAGNTAEGNLKWYIRNMETGEILHRFYARDYHEAMVELAWWKQQNPELDLKYGRDDDVPPGQAMSGDWAVWVPGRERFVTIGNAGARRFNTQADAEAWIQNYNASNPGNNLELTAREFAPPAQRQMQPGDIVAPGLGELPNLFPELPAPDFSQLGSGTSGRERWQILSMGTGRQVGEFNADSYQGAIQHMRQALTRAGLDPEQYTVSPVESPPAPAARTGEFTGEWKIVDANGREIHRFGGVGNVQADANRVALAWLRQNPGNMRDGVEVVPVMSE